MLFHISTGYREAGLIQLTALPEDRESLHFSSISLRLEQHPQRQLNVPRVVFLGQSHGACRSQGQARAGNVELRRIRGIERFRAELHPEALVNRDGLEHGDVRVRHLGWAEGRKITAQRPRRIRILLDEGKRQGLAVEGAVLRGAAGEQRARIESLRLVCAGQLGVDLRRPVAARCGQRETHLALKDAVELPALQKHGHNPVCVCKERNLEVAADHDAVRRIGAVQRAIRRLRDGLLGVQVRSRVQPPLVRVAHQYVQAARHPLAEYQAALRIQPDRAAAHYNLANALVRVPGRLPDAIAEYQAALRIEPDFAEAHVNLANTLAQTPGRLSEAIAEYEAALRIRPDPQVRQMVDQLRARQQQAELFR